MKQQGLIKLLNLANIQLTLDQLIFDNIDTSSNWERAKEELSVLDNEFTQFFKAFIESNAGQLPKANAYWGLFMDLAAKIVYFSAYVEKKLNQMPSSFIQKQIEDAASFYPNSGHAFNKELFDEMKQSYERVAGTTLQIQNYTVLQTIENYSNYVKTK